MVGLDPARAVLSQSIPAAYCLLVVRHWQARPPVAGTDRTSNQAQTENIQPVRDRLPRSKKVLGRRSCTHIACVAVRLSAADCSIAAMPVSRYIVPASRYIMRHRLLFSLRLGCAARGSKRIVLTRLEAGRVYLANLPLCALEDSTSTRASMTLVNPTPSAPDRIALTCNSSKRAVSISNISFITTLILSWAMTGPMTRFAMTGPMTRFRATCFYLCRGGLSLYILRARHGWF